ncbi:MAG: M48 family metallopeptidase [Patescibacteria group bacterium]|nr:M48 family metallopeptidase [Patescibacteria group bacterium]
MEIIPILKIEHRRVRRSRHVRLSLSVDGRVLVTRPFWVSEKFAQSFVLEKREWLHNQLKKIQSMPVSVLGKGTRSDYLRYKERARVIATERLIYFNQFYSFPYKRLSIRDQKTRWGSCSKSGGLNFNYRLVFLPPELQDYLIVHELCHLKELNHSADFWALVAQRIPDFKKKRQYLRNFK